MIRSVRVIRDIPIFRHVLSRVAKKGTDITGNSGKDFLDKHIHTFNIESRIKVQNRINNKQ